MTTIAITGVSGLLGARLAAALEAGSDVTRIVGLDLVAPRDPGSPRFVFRPADVRDPRIADALAGVDVLVHLAFQDEPDPSEAGMWATNVAGTRTVVEAAERAGVRHVVHVSSSEVYGAHADNDLPLTEDSPLRGTPDCLVAEHRLEAETWLESWIAEPRSTRLTVLRPAPVVGTGVRNLVTRVLEAPRIPTVRGHAPPLQFVHVNDVVSAIEHVVDRGLAGAYNVAAEGWLSFDDSMDIIGRRPVHVPEELAFGTTDRLWKLGLEAYPPGLVHHLMHPCVLSPAALVATGWQPRFSNRTALTETVEEHAPYVAVAGVRMRRATLGRGAAAAVVGTVWGTGLVWRRLRRGHRGAHVVRGHARKGSGSGSG